LIVLHIFKEILHGDISPRSECPSITAQLQEGALSKVRQASVTGRGETENWAAWGAARNELVRLQKRIGAGIGPLLML